MEFIIVFLLGVIISVLLSINQTYELLVSDDKEFKIAERYKVFQSDSILPPLTSVYEYMMIYVTFVSMFHIFFGDFNIMNDNVETLVTFLIGAFGVAYTLKTIIRYVRVLFMSHSTENLKKCFMTISPIRYNKTIELSNGKVHTNTYIRFSYIDMLFVVWLNSWYKVRHNKR